EPPLEEVYTRVIDRRHHAACGEAALREASATAEVFGQPLEAVESMQRRFWVTQGPRPIAHTRASKHSKLEVQHSSMRATPDEGVEYADAVRLPLRELKAAIPHPASESHVIEGYLSVMQLTAGYARTENRQRMLRECEDGGTRHRGIKLARQGRHRATG